MNECAQEHSVTPTLLVILSLPKFVFTSLRFCLSNQVDENHSSLAEPFPTVRNFGLHGEAPHIHMQFIPIPRNGCPSRRGSVSSFTQQWKMDARHNSSWHSFPPFGRVLGVQIGPTTGPEIKFMDMDGILTHTSDNHQLSNTLIMLSLSQSFLQPGLENVKGICIFIYC